MDTTEQHIYDDNRRTVWDTIEHAQELLDSTQRRLEAGNDNLAVLSNLASVIRRLTNAQRALVVATRVAGASWASLGAVLDISRQAAQQTYGGEATAWPEEPTAPLADAIIDAVIGAAPLADAIVAAARARHEVEG